MENLKTVSQQKAAVKITLTRAEFIKKYINMPKTKIALKA